MELDNIEIEQQSEEFTNDNSTENLAPRYQVIDFSVIPTGNDIHLLPADKMVTIINQILEMFRVVEEDAIKLASLESKIDEIYKKIDSYNGLSHTGTIISLLIIILFGGIGTVMFPIIGTIIGGIIGGYLAYLIDTKIIEKILKTEEKHAKKREELKKGLEPLEAQFDQIAMESNVFLKSEGVKRANAAIPAEFYNKSALASLKEILETRRADNLKEAINVYDTKMHHMKMESLQEKNINLTQSILQESQKQTQYAETAAQNSKITAENSKVAAQNSKKTLRNARVQTVLNYGIYKEVKK